MRRPLAAALTAALLLALPGATSAQQVAVAPPTPEEIRAYYDAQAPGWPDLPQGVLAAFVAAEDRNFPDRPAARSVITLQVAAWLAAPGSGRFDTTVLTLALARALSREQILDWYASRVYLGQGCYGAPAAAQAYFGKPLDLLAPEERAYLAALPKAPAQFHPVRAHDRAVTRRNFVLGEMAKTGALAQSEAAEAMDRPLVTRDPLGTCDPE